uniref:Peptidase S1 domain-containing protein n=1 Tax=Anopheles epiroticus TaxID=199890 RepID=A0A182P846_9DIPT
MVSRSVLLVVFSLLSQSIEAFHNLYPIDIGLSEEDPFMPNEREVFDDCHMRYMRYGKDELEVADSLEPYDEPRDYSHIAAIGRRETGDTIEWTCIGTLIWDSVVITSAHCTTDKGLNGAPSVVRLGGPKYVQQRNVKEVIRHPEFSPSDGQHDIALLQLDRKVAINETVVPTCLWLWDDVPFDKLDYIVRIAASKEQQLAEYATVDMTKLNVKGEECLSPTTSQKGIPDSQLCVKPVELDQNGCKDSPEGNPLQMRLLHNFKTSPFLVGIRSSSFTSDSCNPRRSFTKIGPYRDWLMQVLLERNVSVTPDNLFPINCARRFASLRPRADELITERNGEVPINSIQVESVHERELKYIVQFEWPSEVENMARLLCAGTFVDQQTVLTLAECVVPSTPRGVQPIAVVHRTRFRNVSHPIKSITVHPGYVEGSQRNNIAVVKLQSNQEVVPACIWTHDALPDSRVDLTGAGMNFLNNYQELFFDETEFGNNLVQPAMDYYPWENCSTELDHLSGNRSLEGLNKNEHLCFRSDQWIVPGVCKDVHGAPILRYINRAGAYFKYVYALTIAGQTCGYGQPTVAMKLAPHAAWLRSVILPNPSSSGRVSSESVIVINPDLKRSDECSNGDGTMGICVPYELCLSTKERLRKGERVTLCTDGSVVCCPWGDIARNSGTNPVRIELDSCEDRYRSIRLQRYSDQSEDESQYTNLPHVAEIGWPQNNGRIEFDCMGFLITPALVLTTARCLETYPHKPTVARIGSVQAADPSNVVLRTIRRVRLHEDYDPQTGENNIAIVVLTAPIEINAHHFPGCLFRNNTHLPTRQFAISEDEQRTFFEKVSPLYRTECEERWTETLAPGQMCLLKAQPESVFRVSNKCLNMGDVIVWENRTQDDIFDVVYLVGLFSHGGCGLNNIQIGTRISFYYDWITTNGK